MSYGVRPPEAAQRAELEDLTRRLLEVAEAGRPAPWLEIFSAVLLSLATVGSAWSAYEATRWSGEQSILQAEATALRIQSSAALGKAAAETQVDVAMFLQWADALSREDQRQADFLRERFRPEMRPALEAWLATRPLQNPDAPPSPFMMKEYVVASRLDADRLLRQADERTAKARTANQINDNYILLTVGFASVLFLGGVGPKFGKATLRTGVTTLGAVIFVVVTVILATFPIH